MSPQDRYSYPIARAVLLRSAALALIAIGFSCELSQLTAQPAAGPAAGDYTPYALRYSRAADVGAALSGLLPPGTDVMVDQQANRLLVRGPLAAQQIVQKVIGSLDTAPSDGTARMAPSGSAPVLRTYACANADPAKTAADLQARFGGVPGVRIVADARTAQILVLAPPEVHQQILAQPGRQEPAGLGSHVSLPGSGLKVSIGTAPPQPPRSQEIQLQNIPATRLETALGEMLGNRLALVPGSSADAPEYRVRLAGGRSIALWVDRRGHRVMVEGSGSAMDSCLRLIQALDAPAQSPDQSLRMISLQTARAADIQRTVDAIRSGNAPQGQSSRDAATPGKPGAAGSPQQAGQAPVAQAAPTAPQGPQAPVPQAPAGAPAGKLEEGGSLIGPVQIEYLEGLDVMVLRGHRRDVEQVMKIIEEIERLSAQTQPSIELYPMQNVNCESMATMVRQLYDEVFASRQGYISITALVKPNALLLIGRQENVNTVLDLVKRLDQPVAPESQFQVFPLKHASAATAQATVTEVFAQRGGLGPVVRATADYRSNSLIVQASPRDVAEIAAVLAKLDTPTSQAVNELRVFKLENTLASELAPVLQDAVNGQAVTGARLPGQAVSPTQAGGGVQKANMLRFVTIDGQGQRRLSSGILTDVRITADTRANALLVSAPDDSMPLLEALIKQMDQLPALEAQIKVFTIINADASSLMDLLTTLFATQGGMYGQRGAMGAMAQAMPMRTAAASGESTLVQLRFAADARTNSIIASGTAGDLSVVEAILVRLDEGDIRNRKNIVYRLKNSPAQQVATALTNFLTSQRQLQTQIVPGLVSPFEQIEHEVVVVPEVVRNALIISATPRYFNEVLKLVEELDERPPMVMIQVLIAQVTLNSTDEFGVELGLQDSVLFDRSVLDAIQNFPVTTTTTTGSGATATTTQTIANNFVSATITPGFLFANPSSSLGNSGSSSAVAGARQVGGQGLTSLGVGRVNNQLGYGGLVLSASSENVSMLIRALKQCQRLEVLSRPQVMTLDNQPAFIQVGQRVPRISAVNITTAGAQSNSIVLDNVGLIMAVTPRISPDGLVVMEIDAENSKVGPEAEGIPVSINVTGDVIRSPRIDTAVAQTTVSATSGQTVVLGGLITKNKTSLHTRVPLLSDIPLLGNLFRFDSEVDRKDELLIIMTPHIVRNEKDAERLKQIEAARMDWCLADVVKLHGDGGLRGRKDDWSSGEVPVIYPDADPMASAKSASGGATPEVIPAPGAAASPAAAGGAGVKTSPTPAPKRDEPAALPPPVPEPPTPRRTP